MTDLIVGIVFLTALGVVLYLVMQYSDKVRRGMMDELEDEEVDEPVVHAPVEIKKEEPKPVEVKAPVVEAPAPKVEEVSAPKVEAAPAPEAKPEPTPGPRKQRRGRPKKKKS